MKKGWKTLLLLSAFSVLGTNASANMLFSDSFDRANSDFLNDSADGMSGTLAPLTYVERGDDLLEATKPDINEHLTNITNNQLYLADGPNASSFYLDHNFTDNAILTDGGMKIGLAVVENRGSNAGADYWCGFGVGNTLTEVEHSYLDYNPDGVVATDPDGIYTRFRGSFGSSQPGVSDLFVCYDQNRGGIIQVIKNGTNPGGGTSYAIEDCSIAEGGSRLELEMFFDDFNAGTNVDVNILWGGAIVGTDSFTWDYDNSNYIGFSARQGNGFIADDLEISTVPEPGTIALLGLGGMLIRRKK